MVDEFADFVMVHYFIESPNKCVQFLGAILNACTNFGCAMLLIWVSYFTLLDNCYLKTDEQDVVEYCSENESDIYTILTEATTIVVINLMQMFIRINVIVNVILDVVYWLICCCPKNKGDKYEEIEDENSFFESNLVNSSPPEQESSPKS